MIDSHRSSQFGARLLEQSGPSHIVRNDRDGLALETQGIGCMHFGFRRLAAYSGLR